MRSSTSQKSEILKDLEYQFSTFRHKHQGKRLRYPKPLRGLAVAALEHGNSWFEVSQAAGVTSRSLRNWRSSNNVATLARKAQPVELKLVESRDAQLAATPSDAIVQIELRSGVRMAFPVSALSERLLSLLQGCSS